MGLKYEAGIDKHKITRVFGVPQSRATGRTLSYLYDTSVSSIADPANFHTGGGDR
jgi:hypothetical protein